MSFPNKGITTCVILCSVVVELLFAFVILINGSVIEEHEIHAVVLLKEVPLAFGAAVSCSDDEVDDFINGEEVITYPLLDDYLNNDVIFM